MLPRPEEFIRGIRKVSGQSGDHGIRLRGIEKIACRAPKETASGSAPRTAKAQLLAADAPWMKTAMG